MNLHRVEGSPDWEAITPARRNMWQRVAAASHGIVTPGNVFSILGLLSVPAALVLIVGHEYYLLGATVLAIGRACDLVDGWLADRTGTKSPLGEKIDASFDKISTGLAVIVLAISAVIPWWVVGLLLLPHLVIAVLAVAAFSGGKVIHPSRLGKLSMAAAWICLLLFVLIPAARGGLKNLVSITAYLIVGVSVIMGTLSIAGYGRDFKQLIKKH